MRENLGCYKRIVGECDEEPVKERLKCLFSCEKGKYQMLLSYEELCVSTVEQCMVLAQMITVDENLKQTILQRCQVLKITVRNCVEEYEKSDPCLGSCVNGCQSDRLNRLDIQGWFECKEECKTCHN
eukprot:TRINITY_DN5687_c0_g1_i3.p1 TRINITY_DN5687_c0_g1~~TRINITY_DN5687_c0_g1_i3.p1  ORF type:complete len:127 (-),score=10.13 TRINITY_DN5687_c0_g1_i3:35-415(-)